MSVLVTFLFLLVFFLLVSFLHALFVNVPPHAPEREESSPLLDTPHPLSVLPLPPRAF